MPWAASLASSSARSLGRKSACPGAHVISRSKTTLSNHGRLLRAQDQSKSLLNRRREDDLASLSIKNAGCLSVYLRVSGSGVHPSSPYPQPQIELPNHLTSSSSFHHHPQNTIIRVPQPSRPIPNSPSGGPVQAAAFPCPALPLLPANVLASHRALTRLTPV